MVAERNGRQAQGSTKNVRGLSIYGYPQCPFCRRVFDLMSSLGLELPIRNTLQDADHRRELSEALGRTTVPVLLIESESGDPKWLPESADIMRYLLDRFGDPS